MGCAACTVAYLTAFYYNVILGWSVYYLFASVRDPLPWTTCNNTWNTPLCHESFEAKAPPLMPHDLAADPYAPPPDFLLPTPTQFTSTPLSTSSSSSTSSSTSIWDQQLQANESACALCNSTTMRAEHVTARARIASPAEEYFECAHFLMHTARTNG